MKTRTEINHDQVCELKTAVMVPGRSGSLSLSGVVVVSPFREKSSKLRDNMMSPVAL